MSYKLSYTAQEVDELLGKVKGGVCLPVVELSTTLTTENTELSAEEKARFNEVAAMGVPIVVNFTLNGIKFGALANAIQAQEDNNAIYGYDSTVKIDGGTITIEVIGSPTVGKWCASIATGDANG